MCTLHLQCSMARRTLIWIIPYKWRSNQPPQKNNYRIITEKIHEQMKGNGSWNLPTYNRNHFLITHLIYYRNNFKFFLFFTNFRLYISPMIKGISKNNLLNGYQINLKDYMVSNKKIPWGRTVYLGTPMTINILSIIYRLVNEWYYMNFS